jgi:uncharacterized protein YjbJ (UPF0337 family)
MGRNDRQNAYNQQNALQQQLYGQLQQQAASIPGDLTPEQKAGITQTTMGGIDTSLGNAKDEAMRRASATGSTAGLPEMQLEAGREGAREKSQAGAQLQEYFAEVPVQRALAKAGVYLPMMGTTTQAMGQVAPQPSQFWNSLAGGAGAAGGGLLMGLGMCWIAEELYGPWSGEVCVLRYWLLYMEKPLPWRIFARLYKHFGLRLARMARTNLYLRAVLKSIFDRALSTARRKIFSGESEWE